MVCTPMNLINAKLEELYDAIVWFFTNTKLVTLFDANNFCYQISQHQLLSPKRSNQMINIEQSAILQNLPEQDMFDSKLKDVIDRGWNAMDPHDQRDSKGQMKFTSSKK